MRGRSSGGGRAPEHCDAPSDTAAAMKSATSVKKVLVVCWNGVDAAAVKMTPRIAASVSTTESAAPARSFTAETGMTAARCGHARGESVRRTAATVFARRAPLLMLAAAGVADTDTTCRVRCEARR